MIQRIQTLYLLLAVILCVAAIFAPIPYAFTGDTSLDIPFTMNEVTQLTGEAQESITNFQKNNDLTQINISSIQHFILPFLSALIALISLVNIFWFRNQIRQIKTCKWAIFLTFILLLAGLALVLIDGKTPDLPYYGAIFPAVVLIANWLAMRGVKSDKKLLDDLNSGRLR